MDASPRLLRGFFGVKTPENYRDYYLVKILKSTELETCLEAKTRFGGVASAPRHLLSKDHFVSAAAGAGPRRQ